MYAQALIKGVEDVDLEKTLISCGDKEDIGEKGDKESNLQDSNYTSSGELDVADEAEAENARRARAEINIKEDVPGVDSDLESYYCGLDDLQSYSSIDEKSLVPVRPRYAKFNHEVHMKNSKFKIGMEFKSMKQFQEAVRNYGIQNRYVMKFKLNNKKKSARLSVSGVSILPVGFTNDERQ